MTDQVDDQFEYQGNKFAIADYSAGIAFHPGILGMEPDPVSTDCWRGYQVTYGLSGDHLQVIRLGVNLVVDTKDYERVEGPVIGGVLLPGSLPINRHFPGDTPLDSWMEHISPGHRAL